MSTDTELTPDTEGAVDERELAAGREDDTTPDDPRGPKKSKRGAIVAGLLFAAPALVLLGAFIVYPIVFTLIRSFFGRTGAEFVGMANYAAMFDSPEILTAIKNNAIWVIVAPSVATAFGLVFAVLTERIKWATAFRLVIFMPMAISFLAVGIIFRLVYQDEPEQGLANAATQGIVHVFRPPGDFAGGEPAQPDRFEDTEAGWVTTDPVATGEPVLFGVTGIAPSLLPEDAQGAAAPETAGAGLTGVVWRDFSPDGTTGEIDGGEVGLGGVEVAAVSEDGAVAATTTTDEQGRFRFDGLAEDGSYRLRLEEASFREPWGGIPWLGPALVTPATIASFVWMWAGFAMMVIAAGLSSIPRETLEAARVDGGTEWQVFRKVMAPQLKPVLIVVFVTLMINVLKIFDLVLVVPPGSSQDDATVLALEMWRVAFGGPQDQGLGSAIAILLFLLVLPAMAFNLRRFKMEDK